VPCITVRYSGGRDGDDRCVPCNGRCVPCNGRCVPYNATPDHISATPEAPPEAPLQRTRTLQLYLRALQRSVLLQLLHNAVLFTYLF